MDFTHEVKTYNISNNLEIACRITSLLSSACSWIQQGQKLHAESETFIAFPEDVVSHSRLEFPNGLCHQNLRTAVKMLIGLIATDGKLSEPYLLIIKHSVTLQKSSMFP
ncbi:hypothetical protein POTOM_049902 [Populus tomentosa]|uniref:Uncharacterized protein n=1 Tax=Populus tomentosa TaxID=118781 RepID=A0A8X7YFF7_POPTO|nr:hypothetical protein POTOM_049902 [Populus tomentosa]